MIHFGQIFKNLHINLLVESRIWVNVSLVQLGIRPTHGPVCESEVILHL